MLLCGSKAAIYGVTYLSQHFKTFLAIFPLVSIQNGSGVELSFVVMVTLRETSKSEDKIKVSTADEVLNVTKLPI